MKRFIVVLAVFSCPMSLLGQSTEADLAARAKQIFGRLPNLMSSQKNPVTPEKVALGKVLFYESRISADGTVSCARCHPFGLYAADGLRLSIGNACKVNPRNAPTVLDAAAQIAEHWIGNRRDVEDQAKLAVLGVASFGMSSFAAVEEKLRAIPGYAPLFQKAFPEDKEPITIDNFALAVGAFERTLVTLSPFDAYLEGDTTALDDSAKRGLDVFMTTGCASCHSGAYLGGEMFNKFGIAEPYWRYTKSTTIDEGRYEVTKSENDKYVFKVPVLRNVAMTSPYFHDGSVDSLGRAVWIMGRVELGDSLSGEKLEEIAAFLKSLTGRIPADALKVPVLPPSE
jgi:cytochrome c peroxidase